MTDTTPPRQPDDHGPRSAATPPGRLISLLVAAVFFVQLLDSTIIATSLPLIAADFGTDAVAMGSAFTIYLLCMAAFIPAAGSLSERFGARNLLVWAVAGFALSSLAAGLAQSLPAFIAARAAQGASAALMAPVGRILVLQHTPRSGIVQAVATITWPALFAPVLGPVVGGWISTHLGWQWNFFINLPLCLIAILLFLRLAPNRPADRVSRFDLRGFLLTSTAIVLSLSGFEAFIAGFGALLSAVLLGLGLLSGIAAIAHLRRSPAPLFDLEVLRIAAFRMTTLGPGTLCRISINASPFLLPLLFQLGFGLSAVEAGSLLLVYFLGNLAMKSVTTPVLRRLGYRRVLVWNGLAAGLAVAAFAMVPADAGQAGLWVLLFVAGLARSMQFTALATLSVAEIEDHQRPAAMTLSAMTQQIAMVLAVACSVAVIRLSQQVSGHVPEAGIGDLRIGLLVLGATGALAALRFLALHPDAGGEASGNVSRSHSRAETTV